ncbi:uncharacterized protein DS421_5g135480 [Arachis hypogaea]|nr:uncharacterized protein DS421_5g135480 [Arachis hypogaea]
MNATTFTPVTRLLLFSSCWSLSGGTTICLNSTMNMLRLATELLYCCHCHLAAMMNGGRSDDLPSQSLGSHGSNSSIRQRRKIKDQTCFCGLKIMIKKFGIPENPDRLFHTCTRYPNGSHCNFFRWVDDDGCEGVAETDVEVGSDYDEWRLNVSWRVGVSA